MGGKPISLPNNTDSNKKHATSQVFGSTDRISTNVREMLQHILFVIRPNLSKNLLIGLLENGLDFRLNQLKIGIHLFLQLSNVAMIVYMHTLRLSHSQNAEPVFTILRNGGYM